VDFQHSFIRLQGGAAKDFMKKHQHTGLLILFGLILLALFISALYRDKNQPNPQDLKFSDFIARVESHEITNVDIGGNVAYGHTAMKQQAVPALPSAPGTPPSNIVKTASTPVEYRVVLPDGDAGVNLLVPALQRNNVPFAFREPKAEGQWLGILTSFFLPVILFIFIFLLFRNAQGGWLSGALLREEPGQDVYGQQGQNYL
jgi:ATP-dependent Zn protease